jgi:S-formylglutathione hydrolase
MDFSIKSKVKISGGQLIRFSHRSRETKTMMTASVFLPSEEKVSTLLYLSGLTCTDENVCIKSGVFKYLAEEKVRFYH